MRKRTPVLPGKVIKRKVVIPSHIERPPYFATGKAIPSYEAPVARYKLDSKEIRSLRTACSLAAEARDFAASLVQPGITTEEIDRIFTDFLLENKQVYPSPINYMGFPKSLCTSINEIMVHGIPDDRVLEDGDLISLDVSVFKHGVHGDNCITVKCGTNQDESAKKLLEFGRECFERSLLVCGPNVPINRIGQSVETYCVQHGYDTNRDFVGHGIGPLFHMRPLVMHCINEEQDVMLPGMVFTIEPILVEKSAKSGRTWSDKWTVPTKDGSWAVQFEHTILITDHGYEVLTK